MSNIIKKIYIKLTLLLYVLPSAGMAMSVVTSNYDQRRNKYIVHQGDSTLGSHTQAINDVLKDKTKISKRHAETAEKEQILKAVMAAALIHKPNEYRLSSVLPSAAMDYSDPIAKHFEILRLTDDYAYELIGKKSGVTSLPGYENLYRFSGIDEATFFKWFGEMAESHKVKAKRATTVANASATPFDHKELIKAAKNAGTDLKKWELVAEMLSNNSTPVDKDVEAEIAAIRLLNEYFKEDHGPDLEGWTDALAEAKRIVALAYNKFNARHVAVSPEAKIKEYLDQSEILKSFVSSENYEVNKIMSAALADHVKQNSNKWLSPETLAKAEQFFLNLKTNTPGDKELTSTLFGTKIQGTWNDFVKFCESNFAWVNVENRLYRRKRMQELFPIYQAFSQEGDRKAFVDFCAPYSVGANKEDKLVIMNNFLPIYQAFSEEGDRNAFVNFCASYSDGENKQYKLVIMNNLLPIYQAFSEEGGRNAFVNFCAPYSDGSNKKDKSSIMKNLLPIYQAFSEEGDMKAFVNFCALYHGENMLIKSFYMNNLLPIYQTFSKPKERDEFVSFCEPHLSASSSTHTEVIEKIKELLSIYKEFPDSVKRKEFISFCELCFPGVTHKEMAEIFPIYQAFLKEGDRNAFVNFCAPYSDGSNKKDKIAIMNNLLPIYQAFSEPKEREEFTSFCELYDSAPAAHTKEMQEILPIYKKFPDSAKREDFIRFCEPYLGKVVSYRQLSVMKSLYSAYQLPEKERQEFLSFCKPYLDELNKGDMPAMMSTLIYLHKWSEEERKDFIRFCEPYLKGFKKKLARMNTLIHLYQSDPADFKLFMSPHVKRDNIRNLEEIIDSYLDRNYLRYMRVDGALKAESANGQRIQPMYETGIDNQLPVVFAEDQFLAQALGPVVATVNVHNFDPVYEVDRLLLWEKVPTPSSGSTQRTIHNGPNKLQNYTTNAEVEDFIKYLDEEIANEKSIIIEGSSIAGTKVVSIIKQMLGLEPKAQGTRGGFAPYLGHSMYYAKPDAPKGDEMLGRVWAYMKNLVNVKTYVTATAKEKDLNDYKKAVVLALVEASGISTTSISTHCQTRTSGELFKLIAWHLPGSKLRPLIAAADAPTVRTDADPKTRIINAATYARQLFNIMRQEDSGQIKRVREEQLGIDGEQPPLWKLYEAYYDDLYRRTKGEPGDGYEKDSNGYRLDEHVLTRDEKGNLVSKYQITPVYDHSGNFVFNDTILRKTPLIVYYQAEFQVFEHTFTELMRKEFEEQRGWTY